MAHGPKETEERIRRTLDALEQFAPDKSFGGMTLAQFKAAVQPSLSARDEIDETEAKLKGLQTERDNADDDSLAKVQQIINGVLADPDFGPDSALYEALGYTRRSDRQSGLTRKTAGKEEKVVK